MNHVISGLVKLTATSVLVASLTACGGAEDRKLKYLEKGKTYLSEKNYDKARIEIKNVLQIDPKFADAFYLMGQLEEKNKELVKAMSNYKKAIELDPKHVEAKVKLATIYVIAGTENYLNDAGDLLLEVKKIQPDYPEADLVLSTIKYKVGSKSDAVKELEAIAQSNPNLVEAISLLSSIYLTDKKEAEAIKLLLKGVSDNPENITLRMSLSKLFTQNKKYSDAEKLIVESVKIEPENYSLQVALSSFYVISKQFDKAEEVLRNAIKQDDEDVQRYLVLVQMLAANVSIKKADEELIEFIQAKPELYELKFSQVKFYESIGKRSQLKDILKKIIAEKEYDVEGVKARTLIAKYLLEEGDMEGAKVYVNETLAEHPNNTDALLIRSKLDLAGLDAIAAINGLRSVIKSEPKNAEASLLLARAYELNKESLLAEDEFKKAIEANPVNAITHINYARYLASKGRMDESINVVDKALTYFKDSYDLMDVKLKILAAQGKEAEVVSLLNVMEQVASTKAEVNLTRGKYYLSKKQYSQAVEEFEKSYKKSQNKYESLKLIVKVYAVSGQKEKAYSRLQSHIDNGETEAFAYQLLGELDVFSGKLDDARAKFELAIKSADTWFLPYTRLAEIYIKENNDEQAIKLYQAAIKKIDNKVQVQVLLAALYERGNEFSKAMTVYEEILNENQGNRLAINNYASLLLDYGNVSDVSKAQNLLKGFEKLQQPAFLDTLAWSYAKAGDYSKAVELLKPIVDKMPKIGVFRYHLGYALYYMGDKAAAKSHLEIAASSEQKFFGKDKAEELLKSI